MKGQDCPQPGTFLEICSHLLSIVQQFKCSRYRGKEEAAFVSVSNITSLTTDIYKESTVKCRTVQMVVHMPTVLKLQ